jgi:hypothetical protein
VSASFQTTSLIFFRVFQFRSFLISMLAAFKWDILENFAFLKEFRPQLLNNSMAWRLPWFSLEHCRLETQSSRVRIQDKSGFFLMKKRLRTLRPWSTWFWVPVLLLYNSFGEIWGQDHIEFNWKTSCFLFLARSKKILQPIFLNSEFVLVVMH